MRNKGALALAVLIAISGVVFLVHRLANGSPRTTAPADVGDSQTLSFAHTTVPVEGADSAASTHPVVPAGLADSGASESTHVAPMRQFTRPAVPQMNPYAVVRDGICVPSNTLDQEKSSRQKWEALLHDPFWRSIFVGVNPEEFSLVKTSLPLDRYVAYWKMKNGQLIHWTGKKVLIPAGTRVFTDRKGHMYLCACGNQVAAVLPATLSATVLPPEQEPPVANLVPLEPEPFSVAPVDLPPENLVPPADSPTPPPSDESGPIPPIPPIFVPLDGEPGPELPPNPPPNPPPQPPAVPEPGTLSLILVGFGASIASIVVRRRSRQSVSSSTDD